MKDRLTSASEGLPKMLDISSAAGGLSYSP
jgi:hypothetical protein